MSHCPRRETPSNDICLRNYDGSCEELLMELLLVASVICVTTLIRWNGDTPFWSREGGLDIAGTPPGDDGDIAGCSAAPYRSRRRLISRSRVRQDEMDSPPSRMDQTLENTQALIAISLQ
jgi:hypothetical protein